MANSFSSSVSIINSSSEEIIGEVLVGFDPHGMVVTPEDRFLLVAIRSEDRILKIDIHSKVVDSFLRVGPNPSNMALTPDGSNLFVNIWGSSQTLVFDVETGSMVKSIDMPELPHEIKMNEG